MSLEKLRLHRPDIYRDTAAAHADECKTLVQLLRLRALRQPHQRSHIFLSDGEREAASLTYAELDRRARAVAAGLQSVGAAGERVLLLYQPGLEYVAAFLGCLYAGAVAVPAYPPRANRGAERLRAVASDARAFAALTTADIRARADSLIRRTPELQRLHWLATDEWADALADDWREPALGGNTLAFLQYTSGSTATPKGVMVSHKNLLANESMIRQVFRQTEQSFVVGWLPLYHDMGLIGNVLQPLYLGVSCALMSPLAFLQRPVRWLRAIAHYRATTSGGPNFAYELCIAKVRPEEREGLDLSTWRVAFNGAEPVRAATLERFAAAFAANGFRRAAFQPCYGLAEATLLVSGSRAGGDPVVKHVSAKELEQHRVAAVVPSDAGARSLVSCGGAATGQRVAVVDPETHDTCSPGEVGEIWVSGPNVAQGYWGREEETERVFRARRADAGDGPFLRTGDLGFVAGGELFVTGRLKDLIIVRGLNYYPHDIEAAAERAHGQFRAGANAAFSATFGDEEQLVVVQEVELRPSRDWPAMAEAIRETVAQEFELQAHAVVLVKPGNVLKTSSGKVQRSLCRSRFCAGELDAVYEWRLGAQPPNARTSDEPARVEAGRVAVWLAEEIAARRGLGVEQIDVDVPLARYGLDSLGAVELAHRLEAATGVRLPMVNFLQDASVAELAAEVERLLAESSAEGDVIEEGGAEGSAQPLSPGQQAIWFLQQLEPDGAAYNIARALRLNADVDAPALGRAFQRLLERHEVLRATFHGTEGDPFMRVHEAAEVSFETADATSWGEPELASRLCEEAHAPFDLSRGPLLRARLFTRGERERVLLLVVHHIVADFWSLSVMLRELGLLYEAEREGTSAGLPPLQTRYADFTRWQRRRLSGAEGERLWAYWQGRLGGEPPVLNLPADRPRPPRQSYKGRAHNFRLGAELTRQLRALSRENGATLYMTLLAGFQVLLHRHTGQDDIWVGSPSAGRTSAKFAPLVGYFVNPLVMRGDLSGQPTFVALLARVRRAALEAFEHQDYPFPLLVERLQPARDPSRSPLFQAMFVLHNMQGGDTRLSALALGRPGVRVTHGGLTFEALPLEQQVAQFDLTLSLAEVDDELAGAFEYNTELFDAETVERMAGHLRRLLEEVTAAPNLPVSHYEMLTPAEHRRLLTEWNGEKTDWPRTATIHSLFEAQVARTPSALAVVAGSRRLTYAELDARASHLAARLRALGVGPEARVGLCLERNAELVVALLAVLKAGGAYVPLDPNYPAERLAFMLEDSGARVVLTHSSLLNRLPETGARRLCLDADADADNAQKSEVLPVSLPLSSTSLAYLIYTSGSTGRPKGVAIEHRNAVAMLDWALRLFGVERLSRVLASTSVCFDLSVFEIFSPLSCGGAVVLADSALELPSLEAAGEVTLINTVPSAMAELARLGALPRSARTVNLAGEPLKGALARAVYAHESVDELYNLYGPSEDTTYSTWALVRRGAAREPVIGRPVSNSQAYVLDERLRPVPVGVAGELYLGGAGVARGYLGRPDLTAERFIPDPLSGEA
ncbi:MAG: amino acid adenylation domain-containing protein, partial [Acidobacteria bacterium]|nr:amino acid adenylation domain-containing protein [Acidobacteriota bacterium]